MDDTTEIVVGSIALVLAIVAFVVLGAVTAVVAVPVAIGYGIYWHQARSPAAQERQQKQLTWALYESTRRKFTSIDVPTYIGKRVGFPSGEDHNVDLQITIAAQLVALERLDDYPPEPPELCDTIEGGRYRDFLNRISPEDYEARIAHICRLAQLCAAPHTLFNLGQVILSACATFPDGRLILPTTSKRLDENYFAQKEVPLHLYKGNDIFGAYLNGTPLKLMAEMEHAEDSIEIPDALRNRHHSIIAGTGHGKTQCLQQMILGDIEDDDACVIVIDSQGSMIEKLLHVTPIERVMYLDGGNIRQPLALSAFSIGSTHRPEDEAKVRTAVALYEHMFAARETALTTTQQTLYRFLSRFLMVIPNANFDTALSILQEGYEPYAEHVAKLDTTSQKFVTHELCDPKDKRASTSYRTTRQEVARRLYALLESRALKGMFNAPSGKVNIPEAIRGKKIILINTAQAVLGDEGAQLFGKYCFAQIAMEVLARPETSDRVYLYLDEAQEYLSDSPIIRRLYEQGRKRGLCMITACQELDQLERAGIDKMINSLTSIKFAGGVSVSDASKLAREMDTDVETIRSVPELSFAAWLKHHGTGIYHVTPGLLEDQIDPDDPSAAAIKTEMLKTFHYKPTWDTEEDTAEDDSEAGVEADEEAEVDYDSYWDESSDVPTGEPETDAGADVDEASGSDPTDEPEADEDNDARRPPPRTGRDGSGGGSNAKRKGSEGEQIDPDAPQDLD